MKPNKRFKRQFKNLVDNKRIIKRIEMLTREDMMKFNDFSSISSSVFGNSIHKKREDDCINVSGDEYMYGSLGADEVFRFNFEDFRGNLSKCDIKGMIFPTVSEKKESLGKTISTPECITPIRIFYSDGTSELGFAFFHKVLPQVNSRKRKFVSYFRKVGKVTKSGEAIYGMTSETPTWMLKYLPRFNENMTDTFDQYDTSEKWAEGKHQDASRILSLVNSLCLEVRDAYDIEYSLVPDCSLKHKVAWGYQYCGLRESWETYEFDQSFGTRKKYLESKINLYTYFKSIYKRDDTCVGVRGIIPLSSLFSINKVNIWEKTETEVWTNLDSTLKGEF